MVEAVTWSFMNARVAEMFGGGGKDLTLINPISADLDVMRPAILPNLLTAAAWNQARGQGDFALFEIGPAYAGTNPETQAKLAAGLRVGATGPRHWADETRAVDVFDVKADALAALAVCGVSGDVLGVTDDAPSWYHPGRSGSLSLGPKTVLAHFGEIHPGILSRLDVKGSAAGFELFLNDVPESMKKGAKTKKLLDPSPFQPLVRDFAFVVGEEVTAAALVEAVESAHKDAELIVDVDVFDLYTGKGMAEGEKSLAVAVTLQPREKTLTDEEIEAVGEKIAAAVTKATGGRLRG
jgi:phenylalanyl-tRNA synthetase beta chain